MIKYILISYLFTAINILPLQANERIYFNTLFKTKINSPTLIANCNNQLWVYSVSKKSLFVISPVSGTIESIIKTLNIHPTTMACFHKQIVISNHTAIFKIIKRGKNYKTLKLKVSKKIPPIKDIFCRDLSCLIIGKAIYSTVDFKNFVQEEVPISSEIAKNPELIKNNPFADWQEKHIISKGEYSKGLILPDNNRLFLDPFRGHIISTNSKDKKTPYQKWGNWGKREETLLFPKSIRYIDHFNAVIVSDVGIKVLQVFNLSGDYLGYITPNEDGGRFLYPAGISTLGQSVFISDFKKNIIYALKIENIKPYISKSTLKPFQLLHKDLSEDKYNNFHEDRCLNCHDGYPKNSAFIFSDIKNSHPRNIAPRMKTTLPLYHKKLVYCNSCHDNHHRDALGSTYTLFGKINKGKTVPHKLRFEIKKLCSKCHPENINKNNNHISLKKRLNRKNIKVVSCEQCHKLHLSNKKLLVNLPPDLCYKCHGRKQKPKSHPMNKKDDVDCLSCHSLHKAKKQNHFAKIYDKKNKTTCTKCHTQFFDLIGKNPHMSPKPKLKIKHSKWAGPEKACIDCHNPHVKKKRGLRSICLGCHNNKPKIHKDENPIILTDRARFIHLENKKITCTTCHEPHGTYSNPMFLRDNKRIKIFCSSCHDSDVDKLYDKYHNYKRKRR